MRWERGTVAERLDGWAGVVRLSVDVGSERLRAIAYPELTGAPEPGEEVLLNTNALRRGLGTGGDALVVARPDAVGAGGVASGDGSADRDVVRGEDVVGGDVCGHMMKVRYTPVQVMVDALDDPGSPHHAALRDADSIEGMPVVAADLHSALPAIVAGILATRPTARIAYVLTDGAALPAAYSRTVATLREAGLLAACISAGQAFGGDHEAVSVPSALLGARHVVGADVAIAIQGPGNLGSGTAWGFSGVQAADALNAAGALGGRPVGRRASPGRTPGHVTGDCPTTARPPTDGSCTSRRPSRSPKPPRTALSSCLWQNSSRHLSWARHGGGASHTRCTRSPPTACTSRSATCP